MPEKSFSELDHKLREMGNNASANREEVDRKLAEMNRRVNEIAAEEIRIGPTRWYQWPIVAFNKLRRR